MNSRVNAIQIFVAAVIVGFLSFGQQGLAATLTATKTVVVSSSNPSTSGQPVTFTATVTPRTGTGTPAGTVAFELGSNVLCDFPISGGVNATCTVTSLPVGTDTVKAMYLGDANFSTSYGTVRQKVNVVKNSTSIVVTSLTPTSIYGQSVEFTATVSSSAGAPPDGEKITFKNGSGALGTGLLAGGIATFTTSTLTAGLHTINASYAGDAQFFLSSGLTHQTVQKVATNLAVSAPQGTPGQPVTVTANVISSSGAFPTGSVTFKNGTLILGRATLSGGKASLSPTFKTAGLFTIQATYAGNTNFDSSTGSGGVNVGSSPIIVNITDGIGNIQAGGSAITFNANVQNDLHNAGVMWTLTANNAACAPACGTLSNNAALAVTYTPPATEPAGANTNPTITATSVTDTTKTSADNFNITAVAACGTGNEAILNGQYAVLIRGFKTSGVNEAIGSFTADGTGKITAAEMDVNDLDHGPRQPVILPSSSSYSVGPDDRGCLNINSTDGTSTFRFVLGSISGGVATKGQIIQFTDTTGSGSRAVGILAKQDASAFSTGLSGNYAFSASGQDVSGGRFISIGAITASAGLFSNGEGDADDAGVADHQVGISGSYDATLDSNGRAIGSLSLPGQASNNFAFYIVSASQAFYVTTDLLGAHTPVEAGELRQQAGSFSDSSMSGPLVFQMDGVNAGSVIADIGILNPNGTGSLSGTDYEDNAGSSKVEALSGTYAVAGNGRVALNIGGPGGFAYLTGPNAGFLLDTGGDEAGEFNRQDPGPFSNASLSGSLLYGGTYNVNNQSSKVETDAVTLDGAGSLSATNDTSSANGLSTGTFTGSYSVNPDGTGNVGSGTVMLVISNNVFVFIDEGDGGSNANPRVTVIQK
ncbi:MAG TPA: Ig-like domain-containing protein [Terriglobales bacterium]|nr:Ig-like domain-containing protein [Terriglobales bacterium]